MYRLVRSSDRLGEDYVGDDRVAKVLSLLLAGRVAFISHHLGGHAAQSRVPGDRSERA